jgi:hypothetical protein
MEKKEKEKIGVVEVGYRSTLFEWLVNATMARLIKWQPTDGPEMNIFYTDTRLKGYKAQSGNLTLEIIVRPDMPSADREKEKQKSDLTKDYGVAFGLRISDGNQSLTITDAPEAVLEKPDDPWKFPSNTMALAILFGRIHKELSGQNLVSSLEGELARLLFSPK